jgi:hypothetical protein
MTERRDANPTPSARGVVAPLCSLWPLRQSGPQAEEATTQGRNWRA